MNTLTDSGQRKGDYIITDRKEDIHTQTNYDFPGDCVVKAKQMKTSNEKWLTK